eukprot:6203627-Pleurochrysis_carterae.AAC.2
MLLSWVATYTKYSTRNSQRRAARASQQAPRPSNVAAKCAAAVHEGAEAPRCSRVSCGERQRAHSQRHTEKIWRTSAAARPLGAHPRETGWGRFCSKKRTRTRQTRLSTLRHFGKRPRRTTSTRRMPMMKCVPAARANVL